MGCNPCGCWNLKDGCITVSVWCVIFCIAQIGIFAWQTVEIKDKQSETKDRHYYQQEYGGTNEDPENQFYTGLFVLQILGLITSFLLLFASLALIYGIHHNSKHVVWPWFPCMIAVILCSVGYCVMWWSRNVHDGYHVVLTIFEMLSVFVNLYCLLCVMTQYMHILNDDVTKPDRYYKDKTRPKEHMEIVYSSRFDEEPKTRITTRQENFYYKPAEKKAETDQWDSAYKRSLDNIELHTQPSPVHQAQPKATLVKTEQATVGPPQKPVQRDKWLEYNLARSNPEISFPVGEKPISPLEEEEGLRATRSVPSILSDDVKVGRHRHRRRGSSRSGRFFVSDSSTESGDDSDEDKSRKSSRRKRRHYSHSREKHLDSARPERRRGRHDYKRRHHRSRDRDDRDKERHREDRERSRRDRSPPPPVPPRPKSTGTDADLWNPKYIPVIPLSGTPNPGITIPQHIVIPQNAEKSLLSGRPQQYHINSEISIGYGNRCLNPTDNQAWGPRTTPFYQPMVIGPSDESEPNETRQASFSPEAYSKNRGSTDV